MKPKLIFVTDQNNELTDIRPMAVTENLPANLVITWFSKIPHPGLDPIGFDAYLKAWHKKHNGRKTPHSPTE